MFQKSLEDGYRHPALIWGVGAQLQGAYKNAAFRICPEAQCSATQRCTQEALNKLVQVLKAIVLC